MQYFNLFDVSNSLLNYANYGKARGLLIAHRHGIPVSSDGWICTTPNDTTNKNTFSSYESKFLCRPDAPMGKGNYLPRGRDLDASDIPLFCEEVQRICKEAIILIFKHPSFQLTGKYIPRYQASGGVVAIIDKSYKIDIEFVGIGFDVGEITRGKDVHTSISIPITELNEEIDTLFRYNKINVIGRRSEISQENYALSRQLRILELTTQLGEKNKIIDRCIPQLPQKLSFALFKKIFQNCIEPVLWSNDSTLGNICGIMMNLYSNHIYPFELWTPMRSMLK